MSISKFQIIKNDKKKCSVCKKSKYLLEFSKETRTSTGLTSKCKSCTHCNTALGSFRDNEEILLSAVQYLRNNKE